MHDVDKVKIIEAYKRGDKIAIIKLSFNIGAADLYTILRKSKVPLRSSDPNHPASSLQTRESAKEKNMAEPKETIEETLRRIEKKVDELDKSLGVLTSTGYMDDEIKIDIILAFIQNGARWGEERDLAKKILRVIQAIENV